MLAACGSETHDEPTPPPTVTLHFEAGNGWAAAAAVTEPAPPVTLVLTFTGPDGAVHETVPYAKGELRLPDLREGAWSARGDGLDANGQVTWTAAPVAFTVREQSATDVRLTFEPLPAPNK